MSIIIRPVVTEKALLDQEKGKYTFHVSKKATKGEIASSFKSIFSLTPVRINTVNIKGKVKTDWRRRQKITKGSYKKAIILVPKNQKIELLSLKKK